MGWPQFISLSFAVQSDTEGRRKIIGQQVEAVLEVFFPRLLGICVGQQLAGVLGQPAWRERQKVRSQDRDGGSKRYSNDRSTGHGVAERING